jgi:transcriptional regulator with XRE-family HTH domain
MNIDLQRRLSMSPILTPSPYARFRAETGVTQAVLAGKAGVDQSRISRIEKGEAPSQAEADKLLDALSQLGSKRAADYKAYAARQWLQIEPPSFWNPELACLEIAEETLGRIVEFLDGEERPWPLRRQIERHREAMLRASRFLTRLDHNLAFIGDMGVGKSTAISFIFDLLIPAALADKLTNRPILETGGGGTTICEVHIKRGPEFGISIVPMTDTELRELVADFCTAKWLGLNGDKRDNGETLSVSREADRAIRNMAGLNRRRETLGGKVTWHDPVTDLARSCGTEEEFRTRILGLVAIDARTSREIWYDSATRKNPMEWVTETFKAVNNGRLKDVSLPRSIDLIIPDFGRSFGEFTISVIDTKGVDDVAVREDLDARLKDPRTTIVFCSRFNDAPGTSTRLLLQHMRQTFSETLDSGKVSVLALPRAGEARAMKDDGGEAALTDAEGYEFKRIQVDGELAAEGLNGVPMIFFNVEADTPEQIREDLFRQISRMRKAVEARLFDLCAAVQDIIENHEAEALNAAIEEVANRLTTFLEGNRRLGAREKLAYAEALSTIRGVRYASTLWASTRRKGEYSGLNIVHLIGVGAARDAKLRSDAWFNGFDAFVNSLKADGDLRLALKTIEQIAVSAKSARTSFLEAAQRASIEVYREPLTQAAVWPVCAGEWGKGPGFKHRVADHLEKWLDAQSKLKETLEDVLENLWDQSVIRSLRKVSQENGNDEADGDSNVVAFPERKSA